MPPSSGHNVICFKCPNLDFLLLALNRSDSARHRKKTFSSCSLLSKYFSMSQCNNGTNFCFSYRISNDTPEITLKLKNMSSKNIFSSFCLYRRWWKGERWNLPWPHQVYQELSKDYQDLILHNTNPRKQFSIILITLRFLYLRDYTEEKRHKTEQLLPCHQQLQEQQQDWCIHQ